LLTAEKMVEKLTDEATRTSYQSAMYKIKAILRSTEKDLLENMDFHIEVISNPASFNAGTISNILPLLLKTISDKEVVRICYTAIYSRETTERLVEPIGIFYAGGHWHLIAYCRMRKDYRDFRADRISGISVTGETYLTQHPPFKEYIGQMYKDTDLTQVVIQVHKSVAMYLENQKYSYGFISASDVGECVEMTFLTAPLEGFVRWYLMFADQARIISPQTLYKQIKAQLGKISAIL